MCLDVCVWPVVRLRKKTDCIPIGQQIDGYPINVKNVAGIWNERWADDGVEWNIYDWRWYDRLMVTEANPSSFGQHRKRRRGMKEGRESLPSVGFEHFHWVTEQRSYLGMHTFPNSLFMQAHQVITCSYAHLPIIIRWPGRVKVNCVTKWSKGHSHLPLIVCAVLEIKSFLLFWVIIFDLKCAV